MAQERPAQTQGARYAIRAVGVDSAILEDGVPIAKIHHGLRCNELVRRANALPEALELLRDVLNVVEWNPALTGEHFTKRVCEFKDARAFLAKEGK